MKTIYKYPLEITDEQTVQAPAGAQWLSVAEQYGVVQAWALVDTTAPTIGYRFRIHGTGNPAHAAEGLRFLGSVQQQGGFLVWHVFIDD